MDPRYWLVVAVILVMGWFAFGVLYNLRSGNGLLRWLQGGLPQIGERTTLRWLGTSVVELVIAKAKKPFKHFVTLVVLAPRDVPWLWLMALLQGRRDVLIFRADLDAPPPVEVELADPTFWTGRLALRQTAEQGWEGQPYQGLQMMAPAGRAAQAEAVLVRLADPMQRLALHYYRFGLRKEAPHLEVQIAFPDRRGDAGQFIAALQTLARAVSEAS
jgi:hypothetical protein